MRTVFEGAVLVLPETGTKIEVEARLAGVEYEPFEEFCLALIRRHVTEGAEC